MLVDVVMVFAVTFIVLVQRFFDIASDARPVGSGGVFDFVADIRIGIVPVEVGVLGKVPADIFLERSVSVTIPVRSFVYGIFKALNGFVVDNVVFLILLYAANRIGGVSVNFVLQTVGEVGIF